MSQFRTRTIAYAAVAAAVTLATAGTAAADPVADFYNAKRITIIVGSGAGGGYDTYGRLVARHLGRQVPGSPGFIVKNMTGASSIIAANHVVNVAPKDGTTIGALQREIALVQIMGQKGPKFKAQELQWLGSLASEAGVCAVATRTGITSFEELFQREFVFGGTGPNITEFHPAMLNNLMAAKTKLIKGYPATPPIHLAIERKEVDGICQSWASFKEQANKMLKTGEIKPLVQMALKPEPEMQKRGIPMFFDFVNDRHLAAGQTVDDVKNYFRLVLASGVMGRPYMVAPGVPPARVKALRTAFVAMTRDAKFVAEATKQRRDVELVTGDEIQDIVKTMAATPKDKLAQLDEHLKFKGKVAQTSFKMARHTGKVSKVGGKGREITISYNGKPALAKVSGSSTKVRVDGKKAKRSDVKVGMTCTFVYPEAGMQAQEVLCKK
jgi:tripartite-type tricarboxylate transporter receptor subunit TctC